MHGGGWVKSAAVVNGVAARRGRWVGGWNFGGAFAVVERLSVTCQVLRAMNSTTYENIENRGIYSPAQVSGAIGEDPFAAEDGGIDEDGLHGEVVI